MIVLETTIKDLLILKPTIFGDARGYFVETFNQSNFEKETGVSVQFVQDNLSLSAKNILRGLHFQNPPFAQGKLVRVSRGSVLDVAVDIRKESKTYGQHVSVLLSAENQHQFWIPAGFAHGFVSLEDNTVFEYKCTNFYQPKEEGTLLWNDPVLEIKWGIESPLISAKDEVGQLFSEFNSPF
jgi:dTDP-4-dehydrorhamnose 3,5-epimerase